MWADEEKENKYFISRVSIIIEGICEWELRNHLMMAERESDARTVA